jgi:hypothetical protein
MNETYKKAKEAGGKCITLGCPKHDWACDSGCNVGWGDCEYYVPDTLCKDGEPKKEGRYERGGREVGELVDSKNKAYGDSVNCIELFLRVLWPQGIPVESYPDVGPFTRIFEKMKRSTSEHAGNDTEDPRKDIAGYGVILAERKKREKLIDETFDRVQMELNSDGVNSTLEFDPR